jgi:hypothetical protein
MKKIRLNLIWYRLSFPFQLAHHPLCDVYSTQVFKLYKIYLCQGCTLIVLGMIFSFISGINGWYSVNLTTLLILIYSILPLLFLVDALYSNRIIKRISRFILGLLLGMTFSVAATSVWYNLLLLMGIIFVNWKIYQLFRKRFPSKDLCVDCEFLNKKPSCPGYILQLEANRKYRKLAYTLLEQDFQEQFGAIKAQREINLD